MVRITAAGAGFRSIVEGIDTTTPAGRMMMRMVGAFDQFERATISERRAAGLASARAEGRVLGRPRKLNPAKEREIAESVLSGRKSGIAMAKQYGINRGTVSRIVAEYPGRRFEAKPCHGWPRAVASRGPEIEHAIVPANVCKQR